MVIKNKDSWLRKVLKEGEMRTLISCQRIKKSRYLINSLGFRREGLVKKYLCIDGNKEGYIHYVLLNLKMEKN